MARILTENIFETKSQLFLRKSTVFTQDVFHKH